MSVSVIFMATICRHNVRNDTKMINTMSENNIGSYNFPEQVLPPSIMELSGIMFIIILFLYLCN